MEYERMTGLQLLNLDERTRRFMLDELDRDVADGSLFLSPRLSERGQASFEQLLRTALGSGTERSLAEELRCHDRMETATRWERPAGAPIVASLPPTAPEALAESEFHRFYVRGLCRRALADGVYTLAIYRARPAEHNGQKADALVGVRMDATSLLEDLRPSPGGAPRRVLPACPDAGLSVRLS
jgi:hypothetical protein